MDKSSDGGPVAGQRPQLMALLWVLTGLASATVILRFSSRGLRGKICWDDLFMLFSLLCFYGCTVCLTVLCAKHGARHIQDVRRLGEETLAQVALLAWITQVFGTIGIAIGKLSIAALLLGLLGITNWFWHKTFIWIFCIGIAVPVNTAFAIFSLTQCSPPAALWDGRIQGTCVDANVVAAYGTFTGSYCTFVNACLALLPASIFFQLQITTVEKWQLSMVFALNIITSICSAMKTYYLSKLPMADDFTWATYSTLAWHTSELFAIIVCGTIPTLKPILDLIRRKNLFATWREGWKSRSTMQKTDSRSRSDHSFRLGSSSCGEHDRYDTDQESTKVLISK